MNESSQLVAISFPVKGMTCRSCVKRVEAALLKHEGVNEADVDLSRQEARINYDPAGVNPDVLKKSVIDAGYSIPDDNATDQGASENRLEYSQTLYSKLIPFLIGLGAAFGVIGFYLGMLTLTSDWYFAKVQFSDYRGWIIALSLGLGIQGFLYSHLRIKLRRETLRGAKSSMAASGGVSTASMVACCAHFLPTLGLPLLSAAAAGLERYQTLFFLFGVFSNLFGIGFMLRMMIKNGLIVPGIFLSRLHLGLKDIG